MTKKESRRQAAVVNGYNYSQNYLLATELVLVEGELLESRQPPKRSRDRACRKDGVDGDERLSKRRMCTIRN